ncbi:nucleoside triphosphate pyrophosphohydrolase [Apibacter muscae]|uniref:Nucleoside triphosphate pyrophosphohydrolase n=1 Tax=Apibacter muscae TaxID=2509004 RepID=A0A563D9P3_9FLAO|nr:nucleoside triphosphate pyrophosphohydrolase [Apibacter muscae]TWP26827.1 nucleoside triphosphate pyrophosphohydrolase [Apibacter muscae]
MSTREKQLESFNKLLDIMDQLREECPWDKKQTFQSLKDLTLEETYELLEAIENKDFEEIKKELGDLMLHLVFYSKIASESDKFDIGDVLNSICDKLIYRHPHIYGSVNVKDENDVKQNWEKLKLKEGRNSVLEGVPSSLPSMIKAYRILDKVKGIGFDFKNESEDINKIIEEFEEFENENDLENKAKEFGDILFSLINFAHRQNINPENALEKTNRKFITRFQTMEYLIKNKNLEIENLSLNELNYFWDEAKSIHNK